MWIVDHAYFGWELGPGSPISRDPFAAARIRPRDPLESGLLWVRKKFGGDRANGLTTTIGSIFGQF